MHPFIPPAVPASTVAPLPEPWEEKPYLLPLSRSLCPALYTPSVSFRISHSISRKKRKREEERDINLIKSYYWRYGGTFCDSIDDSAECCVTSRRLHSVSFGLSVSQPSKDTQCCGVRPSAAIRACVCVQYQCVLTLCFVSALKRRGQ